MEEKVPRAVAVTVIRVRDGRPIGAIRTGVTERSPVADTGGGKKNVGGYVVAFSRIERK